MAVYAVGDVQGCYDELMRLLERLRFDSTHDRLWLVGDLVNRGPRSLDVLRFVHGLGDRGVTVLGNHDLHLLAVAQGVERVKRGDTLDEILNAPDRDALLDWLRQRPLLQHDEALSYTMVHAGLPPQWSLATARQCAAEAEALLRSDSYAKFFAHMYGDQPDRWSDDLRGWDRLRYIVNAFTRLRYCDPSGRLMLKEKGAPTSSQALIPWFRMPQRRSAEARIVFGHWSTLGLVTETGVYALDTGCVWGGKLTALRLDAEPEVTAVSCPGAHASGENA